ncbi:unnamed protein product [Brassica rapa subsp. trilocularis]
MSVQISARWPFPWTDPCTDLDISSSFDGLDRPRGGSNVSDKGLNLSGSWQQGHSATYNTPSKGSIGHAFTVRIRTENQNQTSFYPFVPHEISVLVELILGHLRYLLTDVPPQPNSPPDNVLRPDRPPKRVLGLKEGVVTPPPIHGISKITLKVVVFHLRRSSHLFYTSQVISQSRTRVKLNRVFFPR